MFKGLGNLAGMLKQAQEMQGRMAKMQEELAQVRVEASAAGGMVTVEASGQQKILSIRIEPSLLDDSDCEMLEDLLVSATNQALDKAKEAAAAELGKLTGNMVIPGLGDALSQLGLGGGPGGGGVSN